MCWREGGERCAAADLDAFVVPAGSVRREDTVVNVGPAAMSLKSMSLDSSLDLGISLAQKHCTAHTPAPLAALR